MSSRSALVLLLAAAATAATAGLAAASVPVPGCANPGAPPASAAPCQGYDCLLQYVQKDDGMFAWTDTGLRLNGTNDAALPKNRVSWTGYVLNVTSQAWLTPQDFNFTPFGGVPRGHIWWHILVVVVPSNRRPAATTDQSFLYLTGGNNNPGPTGGVPAAGDEDMLVVSDVAMNTGTVGAALFQVPNQHIVFAADPVQQSREEDAVIAFTWQAFVQDPTRVEWPLRLPMTKAGVKAMDAMQLFLKQLDGTVLNKFVVAGASKRGWTTWTVGAVDPRVALIVPIVMDELNFVQNIHHHFKSYGGWTFALKDYTDLNFTRCLDHPNTQALMDIVDPYNYMEKLTMPKLVVNSGMDEFFLPDDTHFWWDKMPEPKHFLMIPNAEHSEATGILELLPDIYTYFNAMLDDSAAARAAGGGSSGSFGSGIEKVVPTFAQATDSATGDITVTVDRSTLPPRTTLKEVNVWHATTCNSQRRDFRIINNGWAPPGSGKVVCLPCGIKVKGLCTNLEILWSKEPLNETAAGTGEFVAHRDLPPDGRWTAFFVDVQFAVAPAAGQAPRGERGDGGVTAEGVPRGLLGWPVLGKEIFEFTSEVSVIPQTFPFPDCSGANCSGSLV